MSYDLSRLYINFTECPKGTRLVDFFSELSPFKEFQECDDRRIKIAILSADIDCPFARIKERDTMMRAIFEELGISVKSGESKKLFEDCLSFKDEKYLFAWLKYLEIVNETDYTDWQLGRKHYAWQLDRANSPQKDGETDAAYAKRLTEAREEVKKLGREIKEIEAKIFPDSKAAREAAIAEAKKKVRLYAEMYGQEYTYL